MADATVPARAPEEERLALAIAAQLPAGKSLDLRVTDNRHTMVSVRRRPEGYAVRLHRMFVLCEPRAVRALARYIVHNDRRASQVLSEYIDENQHVIQDAPPRTRIARLRPAGRVHDLQEIFDQLNRERFGGTLDARITWGTAPRGVGARKSIKMGSFSVEDRLIRIHPLLDAARVPTFFVAWIVFHEMLHGKYDVIRKNGRRCFHPEELLAEERTFPDYIRARAWERTNLDWLLGGT